jgi:hypothetical protein
MGGVFGGLADFPEKRPGIYRALLLKILANTLDWSG